MMGDMLKLCDKVREIAYAIHVYHGNGYLEKVYENAMAIELRKLGLDVRQQQSVKVYYEGEVVGDYFADLIVDGNVIVELKAVSRLDSSHEVQLVNYLKATRIEVGLALNFGRKMEVRRRIFDR